MGATQPGCAVISPIRAAGSAPTKTVADPFAIIPGPLGMQPGNMQGAVMSVSRAAGMFPIRTVGCPLTIINGSGGWGTGVGVGAGG